MAGGYEWKEISEEHYINIPPEMITNRACVDRDGLVTIRVANIMQDQLVKLADLLIVD
jgi:hypothetical protein